MSIYAAFGIPEVWQYNGKRLLFQLLGSDKVYSANSHSLAFPFLANGDLEKYLAIRNDMGETDLVRQFRQWVRERIAAEWK